jgi:hypothetical protein
MGESGMVEDHDPEALAEETKESIKKIRKMLREHEETMAKDEKEPTLFRSKD